MPGRIDKTHDQEYRSKVESFTHKRIIRQQPWVKMNLYLSMSICYNICIVNNNSTSLIVNPCLAPFFMPTKQFSQAKPSENIFLISNFHLSKSSVFLASVSSAQVLTFFSSNPNLHQHNSLLSSPLAPTFNYLSPHFHRLTSALLSAKSSLLSAQVLILIDLGVTPLTLR